MFKNVLGNNRVRDLLISSAITDKVSHSYLFVGVEGIGKKLIAKEFAKMSSKVKLQRNQLFQIEKFI